MCSHATPLNMALSWNNKLCDKQTNTCSIRIFIFFSCCHTRLPHFQHPVAQKMNLKCHLVNYCRGLLSRLKKTRVQVQRFNVISSWKINRLQLARAFILELHYSAVVELSPGIISQEKPQPRTIRTKSSACAFSVLILTLSGTFMPPPTRHLPFGSLYGLPVTTL